MIHDSQNPSYLVLCHFSILNWIIKFRLERKIAVREREIIDTFKFIQTLIFSYTDSFIHSLIHLFIHSFIHSYTEINSADRQFVSHLNQFATPLSKDI